MLEILRIHGKTRIKRTDKEIEMIEVRDVVVAEEEAEAIMMTMIEARPGVRIPNEAVVVVAANTEIKKGMKKRGKDQKPQKIEIILKKMKKTTK